MTSLSRRSAVSAGWMIASRAISRLLGFANTILLARLLVPADFGLIAMAMTFETAILMMSTFPVQDALLRRRESDTELHDAAFTIQVLRALVLSVIIAAGSPVAAAWFGESRLTLVLLALAVTTAINGFANIGVVEFQRELRFDLQLMLQIVPAALQVIATLAVAWTTRSYWAIIVGLAVLRASRVALTYIFHPYRPRISLKGWHPLVGFSFWLWLTSLAAMVSNLADNFIIGPIFGSVGLGLYVIAGQVAALPTTELVLPVSSVLLASFAYAQREGKADSASPFTVTSVLMLLLAPIALAISAGAPGMVSLLLGSKWIAAIPLVMIGTAQCLFQPFIQVVAAALVARGNVRHQFIVSAAAAVLRVVILVPAALTQSLMVVVLAGLGAIAANSLLYAFAVGSDLKAAIGDFLNGLTRILLATLAAAATVLALGLGWHFPVGQADHLSEFLNLALVGLIVCAVYVPSLFAMWIASGRPNGAERTLLNLVEEFVADRRIGRVVGRIANGTRGTSPRPIKNSSTVDP